MIKHATYIGPAVEKNIREGMTALIQTDYLPGLVLAQFDDFNAMRWGIHQAFGWHEYPAEHFKVDSEEE